MRLTKTVNSGLADAASELTILLGVKPVVIATASTIDELETAICCSVIVPD